MLKEPQYCPEWDFALISPGDAEMAVCICFDEKLTKRDAVRRQNRSMPWCFW